MSTRDRKEREKREMQELILGAAIEIFSNEGIENLSIRKIAAKIEYSPAIIYHYFKDKDDIVNNIMRRGYGKIVEGLNSAQEGPDDPEIRMKAMMLKVIDMALEIPEEYMAVQLNSAPGVLSHTAALYKGAVKEKPALGMLYKCVKEICGDMGDEAAELTSQIIWTATFGLILKLIVEKDIFEEQRNKLIQHHVKCIIDRMILGRPLNNR